MNGNATATMRAGCLTAAAAPTRTAPRSHDQLVMHASHNPMTTSPIMRESLWAPPMKSTMRIGLRVENHAAKCGSRPTLRATRDISRPMAMTPRTAGIRMNTADQYGLSPVR